MQGDPDAQAARKQCCLCAKQLSLSRSGRGTSNVASGQEDALRMASQAYGEEWVAGYRSFTACSRMPRDFCGQCFKACKNAVHRLRTAASVDIHAPMRWRCEVWDARRHTRSETSTSEPKAKAAKISPGGARTRFAPCAASHPKPRGQMKRGGRPFGRRCRR